MNSRIFHGETIHHRLQPAQHRFRYPMFWLSLDLAELAKLDETVRGFAYNARALAAIYDDNYGGVQTGSLHEKVKRLLASVDLDEGVTRVTLLTIPRIFGYVFNPVSFYLCEGGEGNLRALIAEVRNTFGEVHHYVMQPEPNSAHDDLTRFQTPKQFYVSPFFDVSGRYEITLRSTPTRMNLTVQLKSNDGCALFAASMSGSSTALTTQTLRATLFRMPLFAAGIMTRISWQAAQLYFRRRLGMFERTTRTLAREQMHRQSIWYDIREWCVRHARRPPTGQPTDSITYQRVTP